MSSKFFHLPVASSSDFQHWTALEENTNKVAHLHGVIYIYTVSQNNM